MLADVVDPRRIRYYGYRPQPLDRCTHEVSMTRYYWSIAIAERDHKNRAIVKK